MYGGTLSSAPLRDIKPIAVDATDLGDCRALLCSADMTATIVTAEGITRTGVPLVKGWNPIAARQVTAISTGTIWGGY